MMETGISRGVGRARVLLAVGVVVFLAAACGSTDHSASDTTSAPTTTSVSPSDTNSAVPALPSGLLPLFPFTGPAKVTQWQHAYQSDGQEPWHLNAAQTAVSFARALGYSEVDRATSETIQGDDAKIGVGFVAPEETPNPLTVAVVHLVRFGSGDQAPWEVVGTEDTTLRLTTPKYGSSVTSPVSVGGRITGVDESLVVTVHTQDGTQIGRADPIPGGGQNQPWSTSVTFTRESGQVLVIAVATGGHLRAVERFAVTGVR